VLFATAVDGQQLVRGVYRHRLRRPVIEHGVPAQVNYQLRWRDADTGDSGRVRPPGRTGGKRLHHHGFQQRLCAERRRHATRRTAVE
jgi:hypothetical protein